MDLNTRIFRSFFLEESWLPAGSTGSAVFTLSSRLLCAGWRSVPVLVWSAGSGCLPGFKFSFLCARRLALLRSDAFGWQHRVCPRRHGPVLTLGPLAARVGGDAALGCRAALSLQAYGWERALCMGAAWRKGAQSPASWCEVKSRNGIHCKLPMPVASLEWRVQRC